jgi:hypothetical protein
MVSITAAPDTATGRVRLTIAFTNTSVTVCKIERQDPVAPWVPIRWGSNYACVGGKPNPPADDFEAPFDVEVTYRVTQVTPAGSETATVTTMLPSGGITWLKDPGFPSRNVALHEVKELPEMTYVARSGVFAVIDRARPVVVAAKRQAWTGVLGFTTATDGERLRIHDLLSRGQVLLLNTPYEYGIDNAYVYAGDVTEARIGLVTEPSRAWSLPLTVVDRPESLSLTPLSIRWIDIKNTYATWGDLAATGKTWNQLVEGS